MLERYKHAKLVQADFDLDSVPVLCDPAGDLEREEDHAFLMGRLARIPSSYAVAIMLRYGLDGGTPMTFEAMGKEFDRHPQTIVQRVYKGIRHLQRNARFDRAADYKFQGDFWR